MSYSVGAVRNVRSGGKRGAHRSQVTMTSMGHMEEDNRDPISAPGTACFVVISVLVICAGIVLLCLAYIGYKNNTGEAAQALKIIGPLVFALGILGVSGGCLYASRMKQKQALEKEAAAAANGLAASSPTAPGAEGAPLAQQHLQSGALSDLLQIPATSGNSNDQVRTDKDDEKEFDEEQLSADGLTPKTVISPVPQTKEDDRRKESK